MEHKQSELTVITKAKDLCSYVMTVTQKSPKQFRFTFTSRLQNLSLNVIENLYRANDVFVTKENASAREKRLEFQHQAMTDLKLLCYCVCDEVPAPTLDRKLIYDNAACRIGKGTHFAIGRVNGFLRSHYNKYSTNGHTFQLQKKNLQSFVLTKASEE